MRDTRTYVCARGWKTRSRTRVCYMASERCNEDEGEKGREIESERKREMRDGTRASACRPCRLGRRRIHGKLMRLAVREEGKKV